MKITSSLNLIASIAFIFIACSDQFDEPGSSNPVSASLESLDPMIAEIVSHTFTPDTVITVSKTTIGSLFTQVDSVQSNTSLSGINSLFREPYYIFKNRFSTTMYGINQQMMGLENWVEGPDNTVAIGVAAKSTRETFQNVGVFMYSLNPDTTINTSTTYFTNTLNEKKPSNSVEIAGFLDENSFSNQANEVMVIIGLGVWIGEHNVDRIWTYLAPFDQNLKYLNITGVESIKVVEYVSDGNVEPISETNPGNHLRTFDYTLQRNRLVKSMVVGWGANALRQKVDRIALKIGELQ